MADSLACMYVSAGSNCRRIKKGDEVWATSFTSCGGAAEYIVLPEKLVALKVGLRSLIPSVIPVLTFECSHTAGPIQRLPVCRWLVRLSISLSWKLQGSRKTRKCLFSVEVVAVVCLNLSLDSVVLFSCQHKPPQDLLLFNWRSTTNVK